MCGFVLQTDHTRHESRRQIRIAVVILLKFLEVAAMVLAILGVAQLWHMSRARSMRAFAARWGFQYIGPSAPKLWNPSHLEIGPTLPAWISHFQPSGFRIRQVWNVVEGQRNGISLLIFDCVIGEYRGGHPCTMIVCQTEQNPFGIATWPDRVIQSHGWTVLHGIWFLWFSWTMRVQRIDTHVDKMQVVRSVPLV